MGCKVKTHMGVKLDTVYGDAMCKQKNIDLGQISCTFIGSKVVML